MAVHSHGRMTLIYILLIECCVLLLAWTTRPIRNGAHYYSRDAIQVSSPLFSQSNRFVNKKKKSSATSQRPLNKPNSNNPRQQKAERTVVIMYHKPRNVVTSHLNNDSTTVNSTHVRKTVYEDILSMQGYVSSNVDEDTHGRLDSSFSQVTRMYSKLNAIGRLDADTSGLLLLTNDGLLVHAVTNPNAQVSFPSSSFSQEKLQNTYQTYKRSESSKYSSTTPQTHPPSSLETISKTYLVRVMGYHTHPNDDDCAEKSNATFMTSLNNTSSSSVGISKLLQGLFIPSEAQPLQPVSDITILSHDPSFYPLTAPHDNEKNATTSSTRRMGTCTWLHITLHQGKNRQIRNMFHAIGSGVLFLHRISIGNIHLSDATTVQDKRARNSRVEYALQPGQWRILSEDEVWQGLGYPSRTIS